MTFDYQEIGYNIRHYRTRNHFKQHDLAELVATSPAHISHIECGRTKLSTELFIQIADALSVSLSNLAKCEMGLAYHSEVHVSDIATLEDSSEIDLSMECYLPSGLNNAERKILLLRIDKKLPFEQIAEELGIKTDTCRKQFSRALAHCRQLMMQENVEEAAKV